MIGLYKYENGDICVEHDNGARLSMPRNEYDLRTIVPPSTELWSKVEFDAWVIGRRLGETIIDFFDPKRVPDGPNNI